MSATVLRQELLDQFRRLVAILHHGLAFVGLAAMVIILVRAKALMQVVPRHHLDKLLEHGGEEAVLDPMINIPVGARILKEYIRRTGSVEAGLQFYNGALADPSIRYAQKVIAERERLQQAVRRLDRPGARSSV